QANLRQCDPNARVLNYGYSGYTAAQLRAMTNWEQAIREEQPEVVSVEQGINDYRKGRTPAQLKADLDNIVGRVLAAAPKTRVKVWLTPQTQKLKISPKAKWSAYRQAMRDVVDKYDPRPGVDVKTFSATAVLPD